MASVLNGPPQEFSIETASGVAKEPAALLLDGTRVIDLIGNVGQLPVYSIWGIRNGIDLSELDHQHRSRLIAGVEEAKATGNGVYVDVGDQILNALPVNDGHGRILVMLVFQQETVEESGLRIELSRLYSNFELTLMQSGVGVVEFDSRRPDWCFADHIELLLNLPKGSLESKRERVRERIHPEDRENNEKVKQLLQSGKDTKCEIRLRDVNGVYRWFSFATRTHNTNTGPRWVGTIADIDDLKNTQLDWVDQVNRRDEFLAKLSHELRNPLMAIQYSVDLLTDFNQTRTSSKEFLKVIDRQTGQMSRLLDDLLDVSRIAQNRFELEIQNHDFNASVRDVVETVRSAIVEKRQSISVKLTGQQVFVDGDIARIKQAMINILENASKYSTEGSNICINSFIQGNDVCFEVVDHGIGIPKSDLEKIFDLFYRIDPEETRSEARGMGVGLFLVKTVIEKHEGHVEVTSEGKETGSAFRVFLPITEQKTCVEESPREFSLGRKTICIVEDVADSRIALKILLEHRGFEVYEFADAQSALDSIPSIVPDAAIIDIGLPDRSGLEVAQELRNKHQLKDMLMVALTGYGQEADCKLIDRAGFDRHLIKPAGIRKVYQVISEFFEPTSNDNGFTARAG